jgi:hypothetical protein
MALPVQTVTPNSEDVLGGKIKTICVDIVGGTTYGAGGFLLKKAGGMKTVLGATVIGCNAAAARMNLSYINATGKCLVTYPTGGATASPAALADPISTAGAQTASAVDAVQPNITPGRGKEVAVNTDLTSCQWRLMLIGY